MDEAYIALLMRNLVGGGIQKTLLRLAESFNQRGYRVDLVVCEAEGPYLEHTPPGVNLVALKCSPFKSVARSLAFGYLLAADPPAVHALPQALRQARETLPWFKPLPALARYLRQARPSALLAAGSILNCVALLARRLVNVPIRLAVSEHNCLSPYIISSAYNKGKPRQWRWSFLPSLIARTYPWADAIVAVSNGAADEFALTAGLPRERITTVYNPVVSTELLEHAWFNPGSPPVVLSAGHLDAVKGYPTLLRAFARVRTQRPARLMILGEGKERSQLEALAADLGIAGDVALPGFVANPFAYMVRAGVFVLSSLNEGLSNVLIEALACGCPVVSTDCPGGPGEILQGGRYGQLVAVGDDRALAYAMLSALESRPDRERLRRRGAEFSVERGTDRYLEILLHGMD